MEVDNPPKTTKTIAKLKVTTLNQVLKKNFNGDRKYYETWGNFVFNWIASLTNDINVCWKLPQILTVIDCKVQELLFQTVGKEIFSERDKARRGIIDSVNKRFFMMDEKYGADKKYSEQEEFENNYPRKRNQTEQVLEYWNYFNKYYDMIEDIWSSFLRHDACHRTSCWSLIQWITSLDGTPLAPFGLLTQLSRRSHRVRYTLDT